MVDPVAADEGLAGCGGHQEGRDKGLTSGFLVVDSTAAVVLWERGPLPAAAAASSGFCTRLCAAVGGACALSCGPGFRIGGGWEKGGGRAGSAPPVLLRCRTVPSLRGAYRYPGRAMQHRELPKRPTYGDAGR